MSLMLVIIITMVLWIGAMVAYIMISNQQSGMQEQIAAVEKLLEHKDLE